ncbi:hypothetical protein [Nostoc sp.]
MGHGEEVAFFPMPNAPRVGGSNLDHPLKGIEFPADFNKSD